MKKSILFLIFFIGSINIIRTFAFDKVSESSSSCSSSVFATASAIAQPDRLNFNEAGPVLRSFNEVGRTTAWKASPDTSSCSSSSSNYSSSSSTGSEKTDYLKNFSDYQKKVTAKMTILKEFTNFPQGIIPMIASHLSEQPTLNLLNALIDITLTPEKRLKNVKEAIALGADVNNPASKGLFDSIPLYFALKLPLEELVFEIVKELIDAGANVNGIHTKRETEIFSVGISNIYHTAFTLSLEQIYQSKTIYEKSLQIAELLLKNNANSNVIMLENAAMAITPLIYYASEPKIIQLLLNYDADPSIGINLEGKKFDIIVKSYSESEKIYKQYLEKKVKKEEPKACVIS